jgi:hypothetical protein
LELNEWRTRQTHQKQHRHWFFFCRNAWN